MWSCSYLDHTLRLGAGVMRGEPAKGCEVSARESAACLCRDSSFLCNRRVFAAADCGIPDGIKVDEAGNVYTGTGEGVAIYSPGVQALLWQPMP